MKKFKPHFIYIYMIDFFAGKHLYFVYVRVLRVNHRESHVPYQKRLLASEVSALFASAPAINRSVMAAPSVQQEFTRRDDGAVGKEAAQVAAMRSGGNGAGTAQGVQKKPVGDDPCAVCFEQMGAPAGLASNRSAAAPNNQAGVAGDVSSSVEAAQPHLTYCALGCGHQFHSACMRKWFECRAADHGSAAETCPRCRAPWASAEQDASGTLGSPSAEAVEDIFTDNTTATASIAPSSVHTPPHEDQGYLNLAQLQPGTRRERDHSNYSEWLDVHISRRSHTSQRGSSPGAGAGAAGTSRP